MATKQYPGQKFTSGDTEFTTTLIELDGSEFAPKEQKRVTLETPEFKTWLAGSQAILDKHQATHSWKEFYHAEELGKFIRVWRRSNDDSESRGSCVAFVAMVDNETKALGTVRAGDVMKSASWKVPAKHARGNIFDASNGLAIMGPYGPEYLK